MPNPGTHRNQSAPRSSNAAIGDLDVHYLDWGGDGEPLLALHGLASSGHWYRRVAPLLAGRYRVIAPDQRGHGATTQAAAGYDWQTLAEDAVRLMDHFGIARAPVLGTRGADTWPATLPCAFRIGYPA